MSQWFRVYDTLVDDPKVQRLPAELFRALINLWCLASQNGGVLPSCEDMAFKLRVPQAKVQSILAQLMEAGLIDADETVGLQPHNWNGRQFKSDSADPTNAERQRRFRNKHKTGVSNGGSNGQNNGESNGDPPVTAKRPEQNRAESEQNITDNNLSSAAPTAPRDDFEQLDAALRKVPGIEKHPVFAAPVIAPIWNLVQKGYSLERQIIPSIRKRLQRANGAKAISDWGYFVPGILEDTKAATPPDSIPDAITEEKWTERLSVARRRKQWDPKWDAMPNQPGCRVPQHLIEPGDGQGWTEWRPER